MQLNQKQKDTRDAFLDAEGFWLPPCPKKTQPLQTKEALCTSFTLVNKIKYSSL